MVAPSHRARWSGLLAILVLSIISGGWLLRRKAAPDGSVYQQARLFENVVASINNHYIDSLGEGELYQTAAQALVASLHDPYAELLSRDAGRRHPLELRWLDRERLERRVPASLAAQRLRAAARFKRPQAGAGGAGGAPALQGGDGRGLVLELLG